VSLAGQHPFEFAVQRLSIRTGKIEQDKIGLERARGVQRSPNESSDAGFAIDQQDFFRELDHAKWVVSELNEHPMYHGYSIARASIACSSADANVSIKSCSRPC
jgi:hypothetical protein